MNDFETVPVGTVAELERLRAELQDRYEQTQCGCGHPACKRCRDDRYTEAVLKDKPETSLDRLKAQWQVEILDYLKRKAADHRDPNYPVVPLSEVQRLIDNRQAEGESP